MSLWLEAAHAALRYAHIAVGFVGLPLFWAPVLTRKGSRIHVFSGRAFLACAAFVGLSGLTSSVWAIVDPASFRPAEWARATPSQQAYVAEGLRFFFSILAFLSLSVLAAIVFGVAAIHTRRDHRRLRHPLFLAVQSTYLLAALGLTAFAGWNLSLGYAGAHPLPDASVTKYWIPFVLGGLSVFGGLAELAYVLQPPPTPMAWWYKHMQNMVGVGVGFHTAFLVFGATRLFALNLPGAWALVPWVLPSLIGLPLLALWTRHYRRRFGELPAARAANRRVTGLKPAD